MSADLYFTSVSSFFSPPNQWRIQGGGRGAMPPPPLAAWNFFGQYINIITKPTAYDGPWEYQSGCL